MFLHNNEIQPLPLKVIDGPYGRFYITPEGGKYPSITTVLGSVEKPQLEEWRKSLGVEKATKETKRAVDRGNAVHLMSERYLNNDSDPTKEAKFEHVSEFNSIKLHLNKIDNIQILETPLYSNTLKVAGRADCIAEFDGILSIVDFKTSTNSKHENIIQDYFLQTTAYALMFHEMYGVQIDQLVIIMSVEKGIPMVFKKKIEDYIAPLCLRINSYYMDKGSK